MQPWQRQLRWPRLTVRWQQNLLRKKLRFERLRQRRLLGYKMSQFLRVQRRKAQFPQTEHLQQGPRQQVQVLVAQLLRRRHPPPLHEQFLHRLHHHRE